MSQGTRDRVRSCSRPGLRGFCVDTRSGVLTPDPVSSKKVRVPPGASTRPGQTRAGPRIDSADRWKVRDGGHEIPFADADPGFTGPSPRVRPSATTGHETARACGQCPPPGQSPRCRRIPRCPDDRRDRLDCPSQSKPVMTLPDRALVIFNAGPLRTAPCVNPWSAPFGLVRTADSTGQYEGGDEGGPGPGAGSPGGSVC